MRLICLSLRAVGLASALFALASPAVAQFAQYTPPGGSSEEPGTRKEKLDQAMEAARWQLGPVRLEPWFGLREIGYADDAQPAGEPVAESGDAQATATVGAGLKAYLPVGPKVVLAGHALPEYVWAEEESLRRANGRYGAGFFGFFNRLTVEATATRTQELGVLTPELLRRTDSRSDQAAASLELRVLRSLYVFGGGTSTQVESLVDAADDPELASLSRLDREEQVLRAGLRLKSRGGWEIGLGMERSEADFDDSADTPGFVDRSNSGTAPVFELLRPEGKLQVAIDLAWRSLEPTGEAAFVPFEGVTGGVRLAWGEGGRLQPSLYTHRNLVYALDPSYSYLESDRYGLRLSFRLGHRTMLATFVEAGVDDYQPTSLAPPRSDDQFAYGASASLQLGRSMSLTLGASREEYDSNIPGRDRDLTMIRGGVTLGRSPSPWY